MTAIIELYANNAYSTLANSISSSATTINLAPGTGVKFPQPVLGTSFFRMTITAASSPNTAIEVVYVINRSTDQLTVQRAQEGTTAVAWSVNDLVANEVTAGMLEQFLQPYYGQDTGSANAYVVSTPNAASAYYNGMPVTFITLNANTTSAPTLNVNGLGISPITNSDGTGLLAGQIPANAVVDCFYNANLSRWELQSLNGVSVTPAPGDNTTKYATTAFVQAALAAYIPSGTKVLFYQASAPTGWSQVTTVNDAAIRIVSGTGGGATGGNTFSSTFVSQAVTGSVSISTATGTVGGTALSIAQLPAHNHGINDGGHTHTVNDPSHAHSMNPPYVYSGTGQAVIGGSGVGFGGITATQNALTGIYLSSATTGISIQNTGSGATHSHSLSMNPQSGAFSGNAIPLNVKYVDVIICSKN
jgi:hypothetical protein